MSQYIIEKCPTCGGDKLQKVSNGKMKCQYCGSIIVVEDSTTEETSDTAKSTNSSPTPQMQQQIIVEVKNENTQIVSSDECDDEEPSIFTNWLFYAFFIITWLIAGVLYIFGVGEDAYVIISVVVSAIITFFLHKFFKK